MPLIKSGTKAIGKQSVKSGVGSTSDVIKRKNVKRTAIDQANAAGTSLLHQTVAPKRKCKTPRVQKKRRRKNLDIFG